MKKVLLILLVLIVLGVLAVAGLLYYGVSNIDGLVKKGIEKGGTWATGVSTTVESVDVGLMAGSLDLDELKISNPSGFSTPHFLALNDSNIRVQLGTIRSERVLIPKVSLSGIDVYLDKGNNPSNYNAILNNLKRFESGDAEKPQGAAGAADKAVIIESLVLEDISIHVANMPGVSLLAGDVAVKIPQIELQNVGEKEAMNVGDVVNLVIKTVLSAAIEAGGGIIPLDVLSDLTSGLASLDSLSDLGIDVLGDLGDLSNIGQVLEDQAGQAIEDITKQGEDAVEEVTDKLEESVNEAVDDVKEEIEKGLGNLLNKKKKEDDG